MSVIYKQQRSLNRVNKILDTAHNVLMDGEINDLSIANLTKVADLKRTSTYKFFPHPDDIKIALIERYINELKEKLENFNVSSSEHHQTLKELINEIYLFCGRTSFPQIGVVTTSNFKKNRNFLRFPGVISGIFLIFYSLFRFIIEFVRVPDEQLGNLILNFSMGQILSIIFFIIGIFLLSKKYETETKN